MARRSEKLETEGKSRKSDICKYIEEVTKEAKMEAVDISRGSYCANTFPTGSLTLDLILGGGWGVGRWQTIFGPPGSGKSTLQYTTQAVLQRAKVPMFVADHEGSADPVYLHRIGVSLKKSKGWFNIPSDVGEVTYRLIRRILKKMPDVDRRELTLPTVVFFIDSLKAMVAEIFDEDDEKNPMGVAARMHRHYIPAVRSLLRRKGAAVIATNQTSASMNPYGEAEVEPGGGAVQFYPDIRLRISRHAPKKGSPGFPSIAKCRNGIIKEDSIHPEGGEDLMMWTTVRTVKNRQFAPYQEGELRINLGKGLDPIFDGLSFLDMTGQVEILNKQRFELKVDGWKRKKGKKLDWVDFGRTVATPEFRDHLRGQIRDNSAFDKYFTVTIGRTSLEESKKGRDPLAIYD